MIVRLQRIDAAVSEVLLGATMAAMRATQVLARAAEANRGWLAVSAVFLATGLSIGSGQYAFGVFIDPLDEAFGWSRTEISAALSLASVGSLFAPVLGRIMDRYGAIPVMLMSMAMMTVSYALRPLMGELWHWYSLSLLQFLAMSGVSQLPAGRLVGIWFQKARGRVMGITMMGNNFGGLMIPPLMTAVVAAASWQTAYLSIALMTVAVMAFTAAAVRERPRDGVPTGVRSDTGLSFTPPSELQGWTVTEAVRSKAFYAIGLALLLGTFTYSTIVPHVFPHLRTEGYSAATASLALSLLATMGMVGKLAFGYLSEQISARYAYMICLGGQALWLLLMLNPDSPAVMWTSVPLFGLCMGGFGALTSLMVQENFGIRYFGSIAGLMNLFTIVSFAIGPLLAGITFDLTDSYHLAFGIVAVMFLAGILCLTQASSSRVPPPEHL